MFTTATAFSIFRNLYFFYSIVVVLISSSSLFQSSVVSSIVLCATALFLSHLLMIDRSPVAAILLLCCSTLFAIAFWRDQKYVINVSVSNARNIFRSIEIEIHLLVGLSFFSIDAVSEFCTVVFVDNKNHLDSCYLPCLLRVRLCFFVPIV